MTDVPHLSLHVPEPAVRPGGQPDFSNVKIAKAANPEPRATDSSARHLTRANMVSTSRGQSQRARRDAKATWPALCGRGAMFRLGDDLADFVPRRGHDEITGCAALRQRAGT